MTKKEVLLVAVVIGSVAVSLLYFTGFSTKILMELVVLGAVAVSMMTKLEKLKDSRLKANAVKLVHMAAIVILSGCFLWDAGVL